MSSHQEKQKVNKYLIYISISMDTDTSWVKSRLSASAKVTNYFISGSLYTNSLQNIGLHHFDPLFPL